MSRKVCDEIIKLYNLPLYADLDEFIDKVTSYLYARYQFENIQMLNASELTFDPKTVDWKKLVIRSVDGVIRMVDKLDELNPIKEAYVPLKPFHQQKMYLCFAFSKGKPFLKKAPKLLLFLTLLKEYWQRHIEFYASLDGKEKRSSKSSEAVVVSKGFLSLNVKDLPETVDMDKTVEKVEKEMIKEMLKRADGVKISAARQLGITERMIGYKIKKYRLS